MTKHYVNGPIRCVKCFNLFCGEQTQKCHVCDKCHDKVTCVNCQQEVSKAYEEAEENISWWQMCLKLMHLTVSP